MAPFCDVVILQMEAEKCTRENDAEAGPALYIEESVTEAF